MIAAPFSLRTIFEVMDEPDNSYPYRIYTSDSSVLMSNLYLMGRRTVFHPIDELATDVANGDVAAYTFIEPRYGDNLNVGLNANSQHPDFAVDEGEAFITRVYEALKKSKGWHDTLLLIVYDEHGGIFDHVFPPPVAPTAANAGLCKSHYPTDQGAKLICEINPIAHPNVTGAHAYYDSIIALVRNAWKPVQAR